MKTVNKPPQTVIIITVCGGLVFFLLQSLYLHLFFDESFIIIIIKELVFGNFYVAINTKAYSLNPLTGNTRKFSS
jgi:hypothetical protein